MRGLYKNVPALVPKTHKMLIYIHKTKKRRTRAGLNKQITRQLASRRSNRDITVSKRAKPQHKQKSGELVPVLDMMNLGERTKVKKQNKKGLPCRRTVFRCFLFGGEKWDRSSLISGHFSATGGPGKGPGRGPARFAPSFSPVDQF